jgi:membrane protease YdiL (CAAX protease family)
MQDERGTTNGWAQSVPWSGTELVLGVFVAWFFWLSAARSVLDAVGFFPWYYGPELVAVAKSAGEDADSVARKQAQERMVLPVRVLAFPFQALTFPLLFGALSGTRPDQLALSRRRFGRNVLYGVAGMLLLTPLVLGIYALLRLWYAGSEQNVEQHALETLAQQGPYPSEWVMIVFTAMVSAPVLEELTFRGVLQPWLATRRWGGHLAMLGSLALAVGARGSKLLPAWSEGIGAFAETSAPALFVLALLPFYLLVWWRSRTPTASAIFGTSLLFACVHATVWPSPVPLFVLGLGLGILAAHTRSLVGPIVLHSLFNGVSCVQLILTN